MSQTLQIQLEQIGPSTMQASARAHTVFVDRPVTKGGGDRGPLGGEYLLIDLTGDRIAELKSLLDRALNTLEPRNTPEWALKLADALRREG